MSDEHIPDHRLLATDHTPEEVAHLGRCAMCRIRVRQAGEFQALEMATWLEDLEEHDTAPPPTEEPVDDDSPRFTDLGTIGVGGMSLVKLARDELLGREVALKVLKLGLDRRLAGRFLREASITAQLEHPNIVPVYDLFDQEDGTPTLVMHVIRGDSLREVIDSERLPSLRERLDVLIKVCDAIAFVHSKGVIHRDLKPDNVMVGEFGEVQVVDFGLGARLAAGSDGWDCRAVTAGRGFTRGGSVMGTLRYMPPEQARGENHRVSYASDIYALGATLWELIVGYPPFPGDDVSAMERVKAGEIPPLRPHCPSVPRDLEAVVVRAMAAEPEDRYPSVLALRGDLVAFLADRPVSVRTPSLSERGWKWFARNRARVIPVAATGLLALLALLGLLFGWVSAVIKGKEEAERLAEEHRKESVIADSERERALIYMATALLAQARSDLRTDPNSARRSLRRVIGVNATPSLSQRHAARLALDTLADWSPEPVVTLFTVGEVPRLVVPPGGERVLVETDDGVQRTFALPAGEDAPPLSADEVRAAEVTPTWGPDDLVPVHMPGPEGEVIELRRPGESAAVTRLALDDPQPIVAWSPDQRLLLVPTRDGVAAVPIAPASAWPDGDRRPGAAAVAISPDGTLLATGEGGEVEVRSRSTRRELAQIPLDPRAEVRSLHFLDGRCLAVGTESGVTVHDLAGGPRREIPTSAPVQVVADTPSGLLAALDDGSLLSITGGEPPQRLPLGAGHVVDVGFEGDVLVIRTTGADAGLRAHRWPSLERLWTYPSDDLVGDGDVGWGKVAQATEDGEVLVLDVSTGEIDWSVPARGGEIAGVALSEGDIVFATRSDHAISALWRGQHLWSWSTGEATGTAMAAHEGLVAMTLDDGTLWWHERGLAERLSEEDPGAVGRRYLAARMPDRAARVLADQPRAVLSRTERTLLVEEGLADPASLLMANLAPGSPAAWAELVGSGTPPGPEPQCPL